jgi:hypothetical protein
MYSVVKSIIEVLWGGMKIQTCWILAKESTALGVITRLSDDRRLSVCCSDLLSG